jgi:hypothetical protein
MFDSGGGKRKPSELSNEFPDGTVSRNGRLCLAESINRRIDFCLSNDIREPRCSESGQSTGPGHSEPATDQVCVLPITSGRLQREAAVAADRNK